MAQFCAHGSRADCRLLSAGYKSVFGSWVYFSSACQILYCAACTVQGRMQAGIGVQGLGFVDVGCLQCWVLDPEEDLKFERP